jgi:two-component system sensor histidine kinase RpfC
MAGAGEAGVAMIGIYLWVTIGNGFRFGPKYLLSSYWLSLVGFGLQLLFVPFWQQHKVVGVGLLLATAIVPLYVLVLLIRLTGQKEAAEQLSNAKSRFVANVSHELRTPLTGVFAVYDLLRLRNLKPDDQELVGMLGNAIGTLKTAVDAVLQMSKLEAGAEKAENRAFNLWHFLHQLALLARPQTALKGLSWDLSIEPDVPANVVGDPNHLSHILGNLLNNAFKFTSVGGVSLRASKLSDERIRFEVSDTGIGIPLEQQERLFERFVQVDNTSKRKFGGTGLGTSIARDLTELMGGSIAVISSPGRGSTFRIELPLNKPDIDAEKADWGAWREVFVIGEPSSERTALVELLCELGLEVVRASGQVPSLETRRYLAAFMVMPASEAARFAGRLDRDQAEAICPWLVLSPSFSRAEYAALLASGAAGLLVGGELTTESLRAALVPLRYRFEIPITQRSLGEPGDSQIKRRSLRVLLADDNSSNRLLISRVLMNAGHEVEAVGRGDAAFEAMAGKSFDIALLDLNMPDISGPDVVKLFRAASIGKSRLPIIILSADATAVAKKESLDAGADEFLAKPIAASTLFAALDRVVASGPPRLIAGEGSGFEATPKETSPSQLLDVDQLQSLRRIARNDLGFLNQYVLAAFGDVEHAISDLRGAIAGDKVRDARAALHIIEGTGGSIGATALVANCRSMRKHLAIRCHAESGAALATLSTTYAITKSALVAQLHDIGRHGVRITSS